MANDKDKTADKEDIKSGFVAELALFEIKENYINVIKTQAGQVNQENHMLIEDILEKLQAITLSHVRETGKTYYLVGGSEPVCCIGECYDVTKKEAGKKVGIKEFRVNFEVISNSKIKLTIDIDFIKVDNNNNSIKKKLKKLLTISSL